MTGKIVKSSAPILFMAVVAFIFLTGPQVHADEDTEMPALTPVTDEVKALKKGILLDSTTTEEEWKKHVDENTPPDTSIYSIKNLPDYIAGQIQPEVEDNTLLPMTTIEELYSKKEYSKILPSLNTLADNKSAPAQYLLGKMYLDGSGVTADTTRGITLIRNAAEGKWPKAQHHLGNLYADGSFVKKDLVEALKWLQIAAQSTQDTELRNRIIEAGTAVAKQLSVNDQKKAAQQAKDWLNQTNE